jgi:lysine-specific demethylase 8
MSLLRRSIGLLSLPNLQQTVDVTESLISLSTDKFYAYPYKHVPRCWRRLYVDASLVQCIARFRRGEYLDAVRGIDMALIMAGGEGRQTELERLLHHLEQVLVKRIKYDIPETFDITKPTLSLRYPIPRISPPSLDTFQKHMTTKHTPLVLTDSIINWPALQSWSSPSYLLKRTLNGSRLVPIELGESYVSDSWTQKLVPFSSFLHDHLLKQSHPRGYLAQHDLLSQIPALRNDILVPDYCHVIPPQSPPDCPRVAYIETDDITMNIWLGPQETKSPLHNDPYENIFAQVVGYKYFRLYPPRMTDKIYPRGLEGGIQMGNTSQVYPFMTKFMTG